MSGATPADEAARHWRRVRDLNRRPRPGSLRHELTIVGHLRAISRLYSDTAHRR